MAHHDSPKLVVLSAAKDLQAGLAVCEEVLRFAQDDSGQCASWTAARQSTNILQSFSRAKESKMPLARATVRQLEAFTATADERSFTAAGQRLGLTPSAVSQLVSELEGVAGFRLFDRTTRKVMLSAEGREFLQPAQTALRYLREVEVTAADLRNRSAGIVRVAAPQVVAGMLLPPALKAYEREQPRVVVRIRDCPVDRLVDAVVRGDADLAVGPDRATDEGVTRHLLVPSPWVLWCSPEHPLAGKRSVRWAELKPHPLVAAGRDHELSVLRMQQGTPEHERITPVDVVENITTALGLAAANLAATLAPAYVQALAAPLGLVMRRVVGPEVVRQLCLYAPSRRPASPASQGLAEFLSQALPRQVKALSRQNPSAVAPRGKAPAKRARL
jgi:DNA-binding transcriptional LysR family regulator